MADINELVERRNKIEAEIASMQQKAAVARAEDARLRGEIAKLLTSLKEEFNCSTLEEAKALRDSLMAGIEKQCDELEAKLDALRGV